MAAIPTSNRLDEPYIHPRQRLARFQLVGGDFEEVIHPPDREPEAAGSHIDHQQGTLVLGEGRPIEQPVAVDDSEECPPDVDESEDAVGGPGDPGGREGRQNLAGTAGKHPAGQIAHLKNDDAHRLRISHLY